VRRALRAARAAGFTLLPVVLAMSLIAAIAFLLNRDNGMNAAMIASGADLDRARYAAEAGLQAINYRVQQQGCGGGFPTSAAPVTNSNFGGGAYAAYADKATGFPLLLSSTGSYNGASVTLSRANVQVFQSAMQTKVLQRGPTTVQDTYVVSGSKNNYGTSTILLLDSAPVDMLLQFDLSSLPAGSRVIPYYDAVGGVLKPGANLSLYQSKSNVGSSGAITAYLMTHSWVEGTQNGGNGTGASGNTYDGTNAWPAGGGYDSRALAAVTYVALNNWYSWDITDAAAAWMGSVYPNYGVRLRPPGTGISNVWYVSSDDTVNVTELPKVTLNYLAPCTLITTVTLTPSQDTWIDDFRTSNNYGAASTFRVYKSSSHGGRGLLLFDLSSLSGKTLASAKLQLYVAPGSVITPSNSTLTVYQVKDTFGLWVEGTGTGSATADGATWKSRDGIVGTGDTWSSGWGGSFVYPPLPPNVSVTSAFVSGTLEWNVKDLAQGWVSGTYPNQGLGVWIDSSQGIDFNSREAASNQPLLVITY
jgi:type II secretory pathway component PulJ